MPGEPHLSFIHDGTTQLLPDLLEQRTSYAGRRQAPCRSRPGLYRPLTQPPTSAWTAYKNEASPCY